MAYSGDLAQKEANCVGEQKKIAVLLAAYNGLSWLPSQIDSIMSQVGVDVKIFISVDLSTDGTFEWCSKTFEGNSAVSCLPYGERFGGAAKNFFRLVRDVNLKEFDYIALSDQDDVWLPEKLQRAVDIIEREGLDGYSGDVIAMWEDGRQFHAKKSYKQKRFDFFFEPAGPGCSYVLKRESILSFQDFLIKNWRVVGDVEYHDWLIYAYYRASGFSWFIDEQPMMYYRQHGGNQIGWNSGIHAYLARIKLVSKKWYRIEVNKIWALVAPFDKSGFSCKGSFLIMNFWQLRRRPRDAWVLLALVMMRVF